MRRGNVHSHTGERRSHRPARPALWRLLAPLLVTALVAAACGGEDGGEDAESDDGPTDPSEYTGAVDDISEQGEPVEGGSITVGLEAETNSWLPGQANYANAGYNIGYSIFDPLIKRTPDGGTAPYLAESMEPNEDLTVWTLTLRPDITFHDGTPLNAQALNTVFDTYLTAPDSNLAASLENVEAMEIVDDLSVAYNLTETNAAFPDILADPAGWPFSPTAAEQFGEDAGANPVGTGPFVFESWQRDSRLVVVKNDDYWQEGLPYLDQITFRPIPDEGTRVDSLATGDIDALQSLRQSTVVDTRELENVDNYEYLGNNTGGNIINTTQPPYDDDRVRTAMALAIDQDALIDVLGGAGITPPATQYFSQDSPFYSEEVAEAWPSNEPEEAIELYQDYINDPERSDGEEPGTPITIDYDCPPDPGLNELSQLYQALWTGIGFEVTLNQVEQATHVTEALSKDYEVKCFRFSSQEDPYFILENAFTEGPLNFTGFQDPTITDNLEVLRTTTDTAERQAAVEEIGMVIAEEVPNTLSGQTLTTIAVRSPIKNIDGWTFPDGSEGNGSPGATVTWGFVWLAE